MWRLAVLMACAVMAGCGTTFNVDSVARLDSGLSALDFNDVSDQYEDRPTFVNLVERGEDGQLLSIKVDFFGKDSHLYIPVESASDLLSFIDKYEKWQALAIQRDEQLEKTIGKTAGWGAFQLEAKFFSGSVGHHFFVVRQCAVGCRQIEDFYFDLEGAKTLRALLLDMKEGRLEPLNVDAIYQ